MSLINDALKRASQSQKDHPREAATGAPMQAVEQAPRGRSKMPIYLCAAAVVALGSAGLFFWLGTSKPAPTKVAKQPAPAAQKKEVASVPSQTAKAAQPASIPQSKPAQIIPVRAAPAAPSRPATVPAPVVAKTQPTAPSPAPVMITAQPQALFPALQVKGIIFRAKNPLAMINGRTLGVGDYIGEARILKIHPRSVTIELNGQTRDYPLD